MSHFNKYKLNANYTTADGIALINPDWTVDQFFFYASNHTFEVIIHWTDENSNITRLLDVVFQANDFPDVAFIEGQILQLSEFSASTKIT